MKWDAKRDAKQDVEREKRIQQRIKDLVRRKGSSFEGHMRRNTKVRRGVMKEMTRRQNGEENQNMALLEKFPQALFGKYALQDIAEGWNDEGDFQEIPVEEYQHSG